MDIELTMRYLIGILLLVTIHGIAMDKPKNTGDQQKSSDQQVIEKTDSTWIGQKFKKFYIGFSNTPRGRKLLTLNITMLDSTDQNVWFKYAMNSLNTLQYGEGTISFNNKIIEFDKKEQGRFYLDEDGKIVMESVSQDSLNYWILKEKY